MYHIIPHLADALIQRNTQLRLETQDLPISSSYVFKERPVIKNAVVWTMR